MLDAMPHPLSRTAVRELARPVLIAVPESDCHVVACKLLELYLKQQGYLVINLGVTTPNDEIAEAVARFRPIAVLISAQNGHALRDLCGLKDELSKRQCSLPLFIGGKLTVGMELDEEEVRARFAAIGFEVLRSFDDAREALLRLAPPQPPTRLEEVLSS